MDGGSGGRALVLGGSVAGLLAARVLSDVYDEVVIVERDRLVDDQGTRPAVPQGSHIHALLGRGQQVLEDMFPGLTGELESLGVPTGDFGTSLNWYFGGRAIKKAETGLTCVAAGRPLLEARIRLRVRAIPGVRFREATDIVGLATVADGARVVGAHVADRPSATEPVGATELIEADLVVDATGRGSRTSRWLEELGYPRVVEDKVRMDLTYTTCDFHGPLRNDPLGDDIAMLPVATPGDRRGAIFARLADRYAISLTGLLGDRPPRQHDELLAYVRTLPLPEIHEALKDATPMGEATTFRFPASVRKRYERLGRFPAGLLVIGDAACIFNPVYGQGMTVAAIEATVLARHLRNSPVPDPRRYFRDLARVIDVPWDMAAGADLGFPEVTGRRTIATRLGNAYITRLQTAATEDARLSRAFLRSAALVDPPQMLMRPGILGRVLFGAPSAPGRTPAAPAARPTDEEGSADVLRPAA